MTKFNENTSLRRREKLGILIGRMLKIQFLKNYVFVPSIMSINMGGKFPIMALNK